MRAVTAGEAQNAPQPYKLGMFQEGARTFVGMVVGDSLVVDLTRANVNAPATLHELIARWDQPTADRLGRLAGEAQRERPSFAFQLSAVKVLVPISDPDAILMAARNYAEHANEMAQAGRTAGTTSVIDEKVRSGIPGLWVRQQNDQRPNPYLFPKLKSSLVADGTPIVLPPGRTRIDYECELVAVIGKTGKARFRRQRAGLRVRIHGDDRRVGPRRSRGRTIRLRLADQQELRHVRTERALHRARPIRRRSTRPCCEVHPERQA